MAKEDHDGARDDFIVTLHCLSRLVSFSAARYFDSLKNRVGRQSTVFVNGRGDGGGNDYCFQQIS
jgi:hypothetical protein